MDSINFASTGRMHTGWKLQYDFNLPFSEIGVILAVFRIDGN